MISSQASDNISQPKQGEEDQQKAEEGEKEQEQQQPEKKAREGKKEQEQGEEEKAREGKKDQEAIQQQQEHQHPHKQHQQHDPQQERTDDDPLAAALGTLSLSIGTLIQAELQGTNSVLELLEKMNLRTADSYNDFGDFAAGLRVFIERLKLKNDSFHKYTQQVDEIDQEVTELEAVVSMLDNYTAALETKLRAAYGERRHG